jgi:hypothetical protein
MASGTSDLLALLGTTTPLTAGETYVTPKLIAGQYSSLSITNYSDQATDITMQFSGDGVHWDVNVSKSFLADVGSTESSVILSKWMRLQIENVSLVNQTVLRVFTYAHIQNSSITATLIPAGVLPPPVRVKGQRVEELEVDHSDAIGAIVDITTVEYDVTAFNTLRIIAISSTSDDFDMQIRYAEAEAEPTIITQDFFYVDATDGVAGLLVDTAIRAPSISINYSTPATGLPMALRTFVYLFEGPPTDEAGGNITVAPFNSDVQVTMPSPGDYEVGVAKYAGMGTWDMAINGGFDKSGFQNRNTFFGYGAGKSAGAKDFSTGVGFDVFQLAGTYRECTAVGAMAGEDMRNSINSVVIGTAAARNLSSGNNNSVMIGRECGVTQAKSGSVWIGSSAANTSLGGNSVAIGHGAGKDIGEFAICMGRNAGDFSAVSSINLGTDCVGTAVVGRLAFGNAMEAPLAKSGVNQEAITDLIKLEWNGLEYRIPAIQSVTATDVLTSTLTNPLGQLAYEDHVGASYAVNILVLGTYYEIQTPIPPVVISSNASTATALLFFATGGFGRIRYTGVSTQACTISMTMTATPVSFSPSRAWDLYAAINGVKIPNSSFRFTTTSAFPLLDVQTFSASLSATLSTNDYVSLFVANLTDIDDLLIRNLHIVISGSKGE